MIDLCNSYNLRSITAHTAVYLMDLAHSLSPIPKSLYQSIGVVCILIASKSEESENTPSLKELTVNNVQTDLKSLELEVLGVINWRLHISTCLHFVQYYCSLGIVFDNEVSDIRTVRHTREYAEIIAELCIAEYEFCKYMPEQLAVVCVAVARKVVGISVCWNSELINITTQNIDDIIFNQVYRFYLSNFPE